MKVSVSFFGREDVKDILVKLNNTDCDFIHVDFADNTFVPSKSLPFSEMKHIGEFTSKRLDVHLMVDQPSKYIPLFAGLNTESIVFHVEVDEDIIKNLNMIKEYSIKCGLAISPDTKVSSLVPYLPLLDEIIIMSVVPGKSGQSFIMESTDKIKEVRELISSYNLNTIIEVDGGINNETVNNCHDADMVVSSSYVLKGENFQEKISSLR